MRDILLTGDQITIGSSQLPIIIRMGQYDRNIATNGDTTNSFYKAVGSGNMGSIGSGNFDFGIDCRHYPLVPDEETAAFKNINNKLSSSIYPTFSRSFFENNFIILTIPDYGQNSMSPFYRDFVPHVYINGLKVWQKYVGMIRHYSQKLAFILIDKNVNNLNKTSIATGTNGDSVVIRVCFKNNIENPFEDVTNNSIVLETRDEDSNEELDLCFTTIGNYDTSLVFSDGSFNSLINNLDDYLFFAVDSNRSNIKQINPLFIKELEITKSTVNGNDIEGQADSYDNVNNLVYDYFTQAYQKDYLNNKKADYNRKVKVKINLRLKEKFLSNNSQVDFIRITSKQNYYDAVYTTSGSLPTELLGNDISTPANINIFSGGGKKQKATDLISGTEFEFIPEYTSTRKIEFTSSNNITAANIAKAYPALYRWYLNSPFILAYDNNGKLISSPSYNSSNIRDLIIYDSGENENTLPTAGAGDSGLSFSVSTDAIPLTNLVLGSNWANETNQYTIAQEPGSVYYRIDFKQTPLSFYIYKPGINITKAQMQARCFPIPLDIKQIDNNIWFLKLPNYLVENKLRKNPTDEINTINQNVNKSFLNSIESFVYIDADITTGSTIYNINHLNKDLTNKAIYGINYLYPLNIVNFSSRNNEE